MDSLDEAAWKRAAADFHSDDAPDIRNAGPSGDEGMCAPSTPRNGHVLRLPGVPGEIGFVFCSSVTRPHHCSNTRAGSLAIQPVAYHLCISFRPLPRLSVLCYLWPC